MIRWSRPGPIARFQVTTAAVLLTACGASPPDAGERVVRDSAGIEIVENHGPDRPAGWRVSGDPVIRVGAFSAADPAYEFTTIRGLVRLSNEHIVALDRQASELRWFDAEGRHVRTAGGKGSGPGEFNDAYRLVRMDGDTLLVEDRPRIRHVRYSADGDVLGEAALDYDRRAELGPWAECMDDTLPDGSLVMCRPEPGYDRPESPPLGRRRSFTRFVRATFDLDTIHRMGLYGGIEQWGIDAGGRTLSVVHPFHSRTRTATGGTASRFAIAVNPEYSIELWSLDGRLERIVRRIGARRAPTAGESEAAVETMRSSPVLRIYTRGDEALTKRYVADVEAPDLIPAVLGLSIDELDHLWVKRTTNVVPRATREYDIFDPDGSYLGRVELPARFTPWDIGEDYILGVHRDEFDVEYIELYGLDRRAHEIGA